MEWVEVTAKTVEEAKYLALDRLGVAVDDAEFEILQQPTKGLFGLMRGEARVRARVRPTAVRPKRDRRDRSRRESREARPAKESQQHTGNEPTGPAGEPAGAVAVEERSASAEATDGQARPAKKRKKRSGGRGGQGGQGGQGGSANGRAQATQAKETSVDVTDQPTDPQVPASQPDVDPAVVGEAAAAFVTGLATAFGATATAEVVADGADLEVRVTGSGLGLLIGPGGRTLAAIQDLARVAAQRKLGDHDTRLKIDIAGYREKRRLALEKFARTVAADVVASGRAKALEPMSSADRKIVHDTITTIEGVVSRSDGDEPTRRVVIAPA